MRLFSHLRRRYSYTGYFKFCDQYSYDLMLKLSFFLQIVLCPHRFRFEAMMSRD